MATIQVEHLARFLCEARALLVQHWNEIARNKDIIPLAPDYVRYQQAEDRGQLLIVTARDLGALVGYLTVFVDQQIHYAGTWWAESDVYWVSPSHRGNGLGEGLFGFAERELKERGVKIFHVRAKNAHPAAGAVLCRTGFEPIETVFAKVLG